jgi:regulatory protein
MTGMARPSQHVAVGVRKEKVPLPPRMTHTDAGDDPSGASRHAFAGMPCAVASITGFKALGRRKQRILVLLDGQPWQEFDAETVVRQGLRAGMTLDADARERLLAADRVVHARKAAAALCARGPRTRLELDRYLRRRGFPDDAVEAALLALTASGTFDEARAVDAVIRRRRRAGSGPRKIEAELLARGVAPDQAASRLGRALADADLQAECDALARRAAVRHQPLADPAKRRKLVQYLLRRGYASEMARSALDRLCRRADIEDDTTPEQP